MAAMIDLTDQDIEDMAKPGGGLKERTIKDRARDFGYFSDFAAKKTETNFGDMVKTLEGRKQFTVIFMEFFGNFLVVVVDLLPPPPPESCWKVHFGRES